MRGKKAKLWRRKSELLHEQMYPNVLVRSIYKDLKLLYKKGIKRPDFFMTAMALRTEDPTAAKLLFKASRETY